MAEQFGEFTVEMCENDRGLMQAWLSCKKNGREYSGSIGMVEHEGYVEANDGEIVEVPDHVVTWAQKLEDEANEGREEIE